MTRKYKIAKIIDEYQVVVNAGSNDLIHDDDCLEVYQPGQEVTDPDTCLLYTSDAADEL